VFVEHCCLDLECVRTCDSGSLSASYSWPVTVSSCSAFYIDARRLPCCSSREWLRQSDDVIGRAARPRSRCSRSAYRTFIHKILTRGRRRCLASQRNRLAVHAPRLTPLDDIHNILHSISNHTVSVLPFLTSTWNTTELICWALSSIFINRRLQAGRGMWPAATPRPRGQCRCYCITHPSTAIDLDIAARFSITGR